MSVAVLHNTNLEYTHIRHLQSSANHACNTAAAYIAWVITQFRPDVLAVESVDPRVSERVGAVTNIVIEAATEAGVPVWSVSKRALIESFALPVPRTRKQLRQIAAAIWPILTVRDHDPLDLEAAALGLYVQIARIFNLSAS